MTRIALEQFDVKSEETNSNLATASEDVTLAAWRGAKLVVPAGALIKRLRCAVKSAGPQRDERPARALDRFPR